MTTWKVRLFVGAMTLGSVATAQAAQVIVGPQQTAAPVMGWWALALLTASLGATAVMYLRRRGLNSLAAGLVAVAVLATATLGYAGRPRVIISGEECNVTDSYFYATNSGTRLLNLCDNNIVVKGLSPCEDSNGSLVSGEPPVDDCEVGTVLGEEDECRLPDCDDD